MITQGIEIVEKAIKADNAGEYEQALNYYRDALSRFTLGIKYEKNKARKDLITERAAGYMKRAEELKDYIQKQNELDQNSGGGGVAAKSGNDGKEDDEKKKLRGALAGAIVTEKPNVRWEDVAGLDNAKESLKEVSPCRWTMVPYLYTCICTVVILLLTTHSDTHTHRQSFYRRNFLNYSQESANRSKASCYTDLRARESLTWQRLSLQKPIRLSFPSVVPT